MIIPRIIKEIIYGFKIYIFWMTMHYIAIYLYHEFCLPKNYIQIIFTPIITMAPHCKAIFYVFNSSTEMMDKMLVYVGLWLIPRITFMKPTMKLHNS